jgi:hypothetical protein
MSLNSLTLTLLEKLTCFDFVRSGSSSSWRSRSGQLPCLRKGLERGKGQLSGLGTLGSIVVGSGGLGGGRAPLGPGPVLQAEAVAWRQLAIQAPNSDFSCWGSWLSGTCVSFMLQVL